MIATAIDFHTLFDHAPNAYMLLDRSLCYLAANREYLRVTGAALADLLGRNVFDKYPHDPDDPANESARLLRDSFERVLRTASPDVIALIHYRIAKPDAAGSPVTEDRYWSAIHTPIVNASGTVEFILQHTVDVTEKHSETAEATQRSFAEAIPQQVWTARPNGLLDFVNRRVVDFFGLPTDQILGPAWLALVHPEDRDGCVARWQRSLETGEEYEYEFRLKRHDGTYRWHLARALAQLDGDGAVIAWFGTNTDMDELKRTRDELHDRAAFEQQVIGIVSHDLRNPLDAIGVGAALLQKRGGLDGRQRTVVDRLVTSSTRASRLVRDFLDFTHVRTAGRLPVNRVDCNLRDLARQAFEEVHVTHADRQGAVQHQGEETGLWDPDRLSQLIGNLVANAFQHSPEGERVSLTTRGGAEGAQIVVHNGGTPIAPETLARLFEPFQRGDANPSKAGSLGLGLYIAKQIALAHGGSIDARSTQQDGTTFTVHLPRR